MPTYTYSCPACGPFDQVRRIAERAVSATCPVCSAPSRRIFDAPHLAHASPALSRAVERAGRSSEAPEVTTTIPPALGRRSEPLRDNRYPPLPRP